MKMVERLEGFELVLGESYAGRTTGKAGVTESRWGWVA